MIYISINQMNDIIKKKLNKIPDDVDLIVANPRSGLIPATIISLVKNLPICDIDSLSKNAIYSCGSTKNNNFVNNVDQARKILIVEDSSYSGNSIDLIKSKIPKRLKDKCILLVLFVNENTKNKCDLYFEVINQNRIFEWNLFHHRYLNYAGIDLNVIFENDVFKIKPTQTIEAIIIDDNLNKEEIEQKLKDANINFNRVIYPGEIDQKIDFVICKEKEKFKDYNIDIIDYDKGVHYSKITKEV